VFNPLHRCEVVSFRMGMCVSFLRSCSRVCVCVCVCDDNAVRLICVFLLLKAVPMNSNRSCVFGVCVCVTVFPVI